ncbi:MAG: M28 family peptidase [Gemmatimonadaceae bacterium]
MMRICSVLLVLAAPLAAQQSRLPEPVRTAGNVIQQDKLKRDADYLASDALRGRRSPSPGLDSAAAYVAKRLEALKLSPAGDADTYRQHYTIRTATLDTASTYLEVGGRRIPFGDSLLVQFFDDAVRFTAPMVYVGHGILAPKKGIDPWANVDVRGKIVIAHGFGAFPAGETFASLGTVDVDWFLAWQTAQKRGAAGLIMIARGNMLRRWDFIRGSEFYLTKTDLQPSVPSAYQLPKFPAVVMRPEQLKHLLAGSNVNVDTLLANAGRGVYQASFALDSTKRATISIGVARQEDQRLHNVVARIEGSDPLLRREAVVLMAHLDGAVGDAPAAANDSIYNAADDNASGTTGLLAVAEAMMRAPRPKRSVVFLWDTGEEVGLWGSRFYAANPVVPLRDVVAHYNVDMIGRSKAPGTNAPEDEELVGPNEIYVIGPRVMSTELDSLIHRTNRSLHDLKLSHRYDLPTHEFFYPRTDGGPLLERGVPVISFADGTHVDYHGVGDEAHKLDLEKMQKVSRLVFATAWLLADSPARPRLDKGIPPSVPRHPALQP